MEKARLRDNTEVVDGNSEKPKLNLAGVQDIIEVREETWGSIIAGWVKSILLFAVFAAFLLALVYTALSATIIFIAPAGHGSYILVARGTFVGGIAPKGSSLYVSNSSSNPQDFLNNIKVGYTGAPSAAIVEVESSQFASVDISGSNVSIKGVQVAGKYVGKEAKESGSVTRQLNNEYLVKCESGSCVPGTLYIISQSQIYGQAKNAK
jgi:hypothetical protein